MSKSKGVITAVSYGPATDDYVYATSNPLISKIETYEESGHMAPIKFVRVFDRGGEVVFSAPISRCELFYEWSKS